jgi:UDP-N-acetylglucosamine 2-epimerase (non-hydrolysing)
LKVLTVLGTRPEAIKLAPVIQELQKRSQVAGSTLNVNPPNVQPANVQRVTLKVCVTAQHRQMLDQVLDLFGIVPDIDLNIMQDDQSSSQVAARVLTSLEPILQAERPDWVLVQEDTTTVMAAAITAHHLRVKVGHVEAGLRTGDRFNPFPEEMNRVIADHLSDLLFAPTERARQNLLREGIPDARIHVTGNTVVDALLDVANRPCPPEVDTLLNCPSEIRNPKSEMF